MSVTVSVTDRDFWLFFVIFGVWTEGIKKPETIDFQRSRSVWVRRFELPAS